MIFYYNVLVGRDKNLTKEIKLFQTEDDEPGPAKPRTVFDSIMEACCLEDYWGSENAVVDHILGIFRHRSSRRVSNNHMGCGSDLRSVKVAGQKT